MRSATRRSTERQENGISGRKLQYWVIPAEQNGEFAVAMEEVLHTYERPDDPQRPVVCMDEQPVQLVCEAREPIAATAAHPQRVDYEYERVTLVLDNLNTHTKGAFYEVFAPARAKQLVERIEFCYTPKHGSWLNIAESELSCMTQQCFQHRRIGDLETLRSEIQTWSSAVNERQRGVNWHMTVDDARYKLKSVYPRILL